MTFPGQRVHTSCRSDCQHAPDTPKIAACRMTLALAAATAYSITIVIAIPSLPSERAFMTHLHTASVGIPFHMTAVLIIVAGILIGAFAHPVPQATYQANTLAPAMVIDLTLPTLTISARRLAKTAPSSLAQQKNPQGHISFWPVNVLRTHTGTFRALRKNRGFCALR